MKSKGYDYCIVHFVPGQKIGSYQSGFVYAIVKCKDMRIAFSLLGREVMKDCIPSTACILSMQMMDEETFNRTNIRVVAEHVRESKKEVLYIDIWSL